jgi:hypothetical protein
METGQGDALGMVTRHAALDETLVHGHIAD